MDNSTLSSLLFKFLTGQASDEELKQLNNWRNSKVANQQFMEQFEMSEKALEDYQLFKSFDKEGVWTKITERTERKSNVVRIGFIFRRLAAVILIGLVVSSVLYVVMKDNPSSDLTKASSITSGGFNAVLKMDSQSDVILSDSTNGQLKERNKLLANINEGRLDYQLVKSLDPVRMEVIVPHRSEYQFVLSDGTKVSMNAGSKVIFEQPFSGVARKIYAEGEVFFEVEKDSGRPFIVELPKGNSVHVLGTKFNVRSYADDGYFQTVLVEGSVLWHGKAGQERIMDPGQLLNYKVIDGEISIKNVDVNPYIAWKEGRFFYEGLDLKQIMDDLRRWYGVEVEFEEEYLKHLHYRINIERYENLNEVLDLITLTEKVKFEFEDSKLVVKQYK